MSKSRMGAPSQMEAEVPAKRIRRLAVTAAVLNALSNPEVIRRMLTIVSPEGPGGPASSRSASRTDGELLYKRSVYQYYTEEARAFCIHIRSLIFSWLQERPR